MAMATFMSYLNIEGDSVVTGPVPLDPFLPNSANLFPKMINRINDSAWELWEFDAFSSDGETAVSVSFYRDARGIKEGGFHVDLNAIWPDGSKWGEELYFPESIITAEADLSSATVQFSVPERVNGTIELSSQGNGRESRLPGTEDSAKLGPAVYYMFPMGPADAKADLAFGVDDENGVVYERKLLVHADNGARGSMVRGWSAVAWPGIMTDAYYLSAVAGPYMLQLIRIVSSAATDFTPYVVARLYRNEKLLCAAQQLVDAQSSKNGVLAADAVVVEKVLEGDRGLTGAFRDKNRGYVVEFVEGAKGGMREEGKRWRFETSHKLAWWSEPTSAPGPQGTGKSGFIEAVFGGSGRHRFGDSDGEMTFEGAGVAGQLQLQ
ncbi:uncharacterized protein BDR25DRAFT_333799 [Lindgomyces ingoldianus]|uniref:Uncharacterized protein n=1 Tax=Lindgomyces ingoldianus TaxID=673940 RepID=A0ACB6QY65_9PLEO|nr:uncharacterized protein BDR25DRAFT_333799 [Lindgomyces ingoldianus]KAF2471752.1 hypothetical protein BDR25DRAFT_333799 [Lindgomyces ingoldianus]